MLLQIRSWKVAAAVSLFLVCAGCPKSESKAPKNEPAASRMTAEGPSAAGEEAEETATEPEMPRESVEVAERAKPQQSAPPAAIPKVILSDEHRAACLVDVGDTLPEAELMGLDGNTHALDSLYGQNLTVVCFWNVGSRRSQLISDAALTDLMRDVAEPFAEKGVRVIAVNVDDPVDVVGKGIEGAQVRFPCLLDPRGEYFSKLASDRRMPRTFLLDAGGRILWFDVEYSRPTRRELLHCIQVALGEL